MGDYDPPERVFPLAREDCDLSVPCSVSSVMTCICIMDHLILNPLYPTNLVVCVFSWSLVGNIKPLNYPPTKGPCWYFINTNPNVLISILIALAPAEREDGIGPPSRTHRVGRTIALNLR